MVFFCFWWTKRYRFLALLYNVLKVLTCYRAAWVLEGLPTFFPSFFLFFFPVFLSRTSSLYSFCDLKNVWERSGEGKQGSDWKQVLKTVRFPSSFLISRYFLVASRTGINLLDFRPWLPKKEELGFNLKYETMREYKTEKKRFLLRISFLAPFQSQFRWEGLRSDMAEFSSSFSVIPKSFCTG